MLISTVILSFNSARSLRRCLDDLIAALQPFDQPCEVVIVDNGSRDDSPAIIREYMRSHPSLVRAHFLEKNTGTTVSRNLALRSVTGRYIQVLDSDAYVNHAALSELMRVLAADARTGIAVPRLFYGSGSFQLSCDVFPTLFHKLRRFLFLRRMEAMEQHLQAVTEPTRVDYAISACWLMRRDAFEKTGLLDERIFYSPEDVDYCLRMWEAGFRVTYVPSAEVIHDAQELSRGFRLTRFHFSHLKGLLYLLKKHRYFFGRSRLYRRLRRFD